MILARNLLQQLNGSKIWVFIFIVSFFVSCDLFKPISGGDVNNNNNGGTELEEVTSGRKVDVDGNIIEEDPVVTDNTDKGDKNNKNGDRDGDGVMDRVDKCPDVFGLVRLEGCPEKKDDGNNSNNGDNEPIDPKGGDIDSGGSTDPISDGNLKSSYKMGIVMPFFAKEVSTASKMPGSAIQGMNFYEGSLLALQQLSAEGVNLDVEIFDSRRNDAIIQGLVDNYTLSKMDLIIGPASSKNVRIVAESVAKKERVPMVSLNLNSSLTSENPFFIQASPYFGTHALATVEYVQKKYLGKKVIMVVPEGGKEMSRLQYYHDKNQGERFNEFYVQKTGNAFSFTGLTDLLTSSDTTVIIAPVSNQGFANGLLRTLNNVRGSKPVIVFGMPSWMSYQTLDVAALEGCNLHVTNGSFVNNNNEATKAFKQTFFTEYGAAPTIEAFKGYDLTLYFGRMLHKHGTGFINKLDESDATLLQSSFDFERVFEVQSDVEMGEDYKIRYHENKFVHILRFQNYQYIQMNNPNSVFND